MIQNSILAIFPFKETGTVQGVENIPGYYSKRSGLNSHFRIFFLLAGLYSHCELKMGKSWLPLEANPEILTAYCRTLGMSENVEFHDVLGVESWALEMVPSPVKAVLLLYPISEKSEVERRSTVTFPESPMFFMKQTIGNACGTIAVLHTLANLYCNKSISLDPSCYILRMLDATWGMDASGRGLWLESDPEIEKAHVETESEGQTAAPSQGQADVDTHFVAFVLGEDGKTILELDGRREGPVVRGMCSDDVDFGEKVLGVIRSVYMAANPEEIRFSILALAKSA